MTMRLMVAVGVCALATGAARAGEVPLYQPVPDWVRPAPPITPAQLSASSPITVLMDNQQRLQDGQVWGYVDTATRVASAEMLSNAGTLSIPWQPSKGDLIVHRLEILRGTERIDLLASGKRFTVIRREQQLEQRELNGVLTATMPIEGLRVGDVVHLTASITAKDAALKGGVQTVALLPAAPMRIGYSRARLLWPAATPMHWRSYAANAKPTLSEARGYRELLIEGVLAKQPELPNDAPVRFQRPALIEASSFADWPAVSKTMAPLYATDGLIPPNTPLAAEVARIKAAETDPLKRAALALDLVQDKVRYLYNGMEGGNYIPQPPAQTWSLRYGDCKAKTLLLLALLHAMDIKAEPVLAPVQAGDLFENRLASPGAFDHVLVRADIGNDAFYLDGTASGTKLADLRDVPPVRTVLPLRLAGAEPMAVPFRAAARPDGEVTLDLDQRAGVSMPTLMTATVKLRGGPAAMLGLVASQATADQKRDLAQEFVTKLVGDVRLTDQSITYDPAEGIATVVASGLLTTPWRKDRGRRRITVDRTVGQIGFTPDRARVAWRTIPVTLGAPERTVFHTRLHLPKGGKGFTFGGDETVAETIAGRAINRRAMMKDGTVSIDEETVSMTPEIAPDAVVATRARVALAQGRLLEVVAPADLAPHSVEAIEAKRNGALKPLLAAYAKAIANDPEDKEVYLNRARFLAGSYDYAAAIPDVTKALEIEPAADTYIWRAYLNELAGDPKKQRADLEEAMALDPSAGAINALARYRIEHGEKDAALAMVQERIDAGGKEAPWFLSIKADLLAQSGAKEEALAAINQAIAAAPDDAHLLNSRCWIKGTLSVQLDTALKDCTRSIELSDNRVSVLDSRAMVYFRLNRYDEALADLAAALDDAPDLAGSLYMRGVIRGKQGQAGDAREDIASARLIAPLIDRDYGRWGIKP